MWLFYVAVPQLHHLTRFDLLTGECGDKCGFYVHVKGLLKSMIFQRKNSWQNNFKFT